MINKRLFAYLGSDKKYVYLQVFVQWIALLLQIILIFILGEMLNTLFLKGALANTMLFSCVFLLVVLLLMKGIMRYVSHVLSYYSGEKVKGKLRKSIYEKLLALNVNYIHYVSTSQITQLSVEGVDQLETYYAKYLPQLFYSLLAPFTLFLLLFRIEWKSALLLLFCVPLIPLSIIAVQRFAKKLLNKYWGMYTNLGERFLDNIKGLTTAKIYQSDAYQHKKMNEEAEKFRKITMRVLIMQLNSISIMDLVAFGGAAIAMLMVLHAFLADQISLGNAFVMIMLSAEFFIPLRLLGSFFHIAMNGNAAATQIFAFLDVEVNKQEEDKVSIKKMHMEVKDVCYAYQSGQNVVSDICMQLQNKGAYALVGESGSGKSTLSALLSKRFSPTDGEIKIDGIKLEDIAHKTLMQWITLVDHQAFLFKGSVRSNLLYGKENASEQEMFHALKQVNLYDFVMAQGGLDFAILEKGANLSGGQAQRLSIARALLHDTPMYIFDEATSNIDVESENDIMQVITMLSKTKVVLMITHRLANIKHFDHIFVLDKGKLIGEGSHEKLYAQNQVYKQMVDTQNHIESYVKGESYAT
ncbi:MAG: ABC transporter ATP-binding protein/permease [Erysipelotrichia bacterium]|nr:ABC transporter ATP-binding protein/permease [Erysipelotrichia bacterium]NCC54672.1 ABC transporter ATP-binding protein/permease [Erysipelotrichia bacterium]